MAVLSFVVAMICSYSRFTHKILLFYTYAGCPVKETFNIFIAILTNNNIDNNTDAACKF